MARTKDKKRSGSRKRGYVIVEGQKYWVQGYSDKELRDNKDKKRREIQDAIDKKGGHMTVRDWADDWLVVYKKGKVNLRHYKDIQGQLNNWILPVIGSMQLKAVRQMDIQKILDQMDGFSSSYIKKVYDTTKSLFRHAVNNRYIAFNPVVDITLPKANKPHERRPITSEERAVIEAVAPVFEGGILYLIMLYAGLRPSEVAALRWEHIDFDGKIIHVKDALKSDDVIATSETKYNGKTISATRDVFLSSKLEAALMVVKEKENPGCGDYVAHKRRPYEDSDGVKRYDHHTKTSMRTMWESFRIAMHKHMGGETDRSIRKYMHGEKNAEGDVISHRETAYTVEIPIDDKVAKDLVPYDLRHTFCTDLRDRGVPIEEAKDLMGHADISLTAKIYSHPTKSSISKARELFDNAEG